MSTVIEGSSDESFAEEQWQTCVVDDDYEICDQYPHNIRKKGSDKVIAQTLNKQSYLQCKLNGKSYKHHRIVALQFIPNDDESKTMVDHINHDRTDNHIENLRWVNASENNRNKSSSKGVSYTYVDSIADDCIVIDHYGNKTLEGYFYDENLDQFYVHDELDRYRILHVIHRKNGQMIIKMRDIDDKQFDFSVKKFKKHFNLD
jgi:hypothetical protein